MGNYGKFFGAHFNSQQLQNGNLKPNDVVIETPLEVQENSAPNKPEPELPSDLQDFDMSNLEIVFSSKFEKLFERGINLLRSEIIAMTEFKPLIIN